jgi:hypothetical protein
MRQGCRCEFHQKWQDESFEEWVEWKEEEYEDW